MEEEISSLYKVIDDANLTKAELEQQMESMRSELRHLEHNHEQVPHTQEHDRAPWAPESPFVNLKPRADDLVHFLCVCPNRTCESSTIRWQDVRWTNPTLP